MLTQKLCIFAKAAYLDVISKRKGKRTDSVLYSKTLQWQKNPKATRQHKNATKNVDNTTIADRLRTVCLGNDTDWCG